MVVPAESVVKIESTAVVDSMDGTKAFTREQSVLRWGGVAGMLGAIILLVSIVSLDRLSSWSAFYCLSPSSSPSIEPCGERALPQRSSAAP